MDYQKEYLELNPGYHSSDAPRKLQDIARTYQGTPQSILDLGCGTGFLTRLIYDRYKPKILTAVDISKKAVEIAMENKSDDIDWVVSDVFDFKPQIEYDLVYVGDLVEHVQSDIDFLKKVGKFGKQILIRVPIENVSINRVLKRFNISDEFERFEKQFGHIHHYSINEFDDLTTKASLKIIRCRVFPLSRRSKWYMELFRLISFIVWKVNSFRAADTFGGFAMYLLEKEIT